MLLIVSVLVGLRSRGRAEGEFGEDEEAGFEMDGDVETEEKKAPGDPFQEEREKYEAKVQQLQNMLNVERDKLKAKETQYHQQSGEFLKVTALKDEVDYLQKRYGEFESERDQLVAKHEAEMKAQKAELEDVMAKMEAEKEELQQNIEREKKVLVKEHGGEVKDLKTEIEDLKARSEVEKENLNKESEKHLGDERRKYEGKIEEIKDRTKDAIQKVIREKDDVIGDLRDENDRMKKEMERLKERIRLLEVEHL